MADTQEDDAETLAEASLPGAPLINLYSFVVAVIPHVIDLCLSL